MNKKQLTKIATIAIIACSFSLMGFMVYEATDPTIDNILSSIGTSKDGYYFWCFDKIGETLGNMDAELEKAGFQSGNLASIFGETITNTFNRFEGVETEDEALSWLEDLIEEVK